MIMEWDIKENYRKIELTTPIWKKKINRKNTSFYQVNVEMHPLSIAKTITELKAEQVNGLPISL